MKRLILSTLVTLAFIQGTAFASTTDEASQPMISAKLKCLSMGGEISNVDVLMENAKRLPLAMSSSYISNASSYRGPAKLVFVRSLPKPSPEAKVGPKAAAPSKPEILATIDLPASGGDFLLLFEGEPTGSLHVLAVPFSSADVPAGSCLVWNITSRKLGLSAGGQKVVLDSTQRQLIKPASSTENYFDLRIFDEYQGKVRPLVGGPHFLDSNSRQLLFIIEKNQGQAAILVRTIEELPELAKPSQIVASYR